MSESGISCPQCGAATRVTDSRRHDGYIRRRRKCRACGWKLTTFEKVAGHPLPEQERLAGAIENLSLETRLFLLQRIADSITSELGAADG